MASYRMKIRTAPVRQKRTARLIARVTAGATFAALGLVPLAQSAAASDSLRCSGSPSETAQLCTTYSDLAVRAMDAVAPGSSTRLAAHLAHGYALTTSATVTCTLTIDCDVWPLAVLAASGVAADAALGDCPIGNVDACDAVAASTDTDVVVAAELHAMLSRIELSPVHDRAASVNAELAALGVRLGGADAEWIIDAVVGTLVLAAILTPADSPGSAAPDNSYRTSVESGAPDGMGGGTCQRGEVVVGVPMPCAGGLDVPIGLSQCAAKFDLFGYLETRSSSSATKFIIDSIAGITDLRWVDPATDKSTCPIPEVRFTGTMLVEATSNANSFLLNKTIRHDLATHTQTLDLGGWYNAQTWVEWELGKVDVDMSWGKPPVPVIHYFSPPGGNYHSTTDGRATWQNGFRFAESRKAAKDYRFRCSKYGLSATGCVTGPA